MPESFKNFWSLNVDEAVAAGKLQHALGRKAQVYFPLNAQLRDVDLLVVNSRTQRAVTLQVKGAKAFEATKSQKAKHGVGSLCWFFIPAKKIYRCQANYFVFILHTISSDLGRERNRRHISTHLLIIKPTVLSRICKEKKILHKDYSFYISVDPLRQRAIEFRDSDKRGVVDLSKYLDACGVKQIQADLKLGS